MSLSPEIEKMIHKITEWGGVREEILKILYRQIEIDADFCKTSCLHCLTTQEKILSQLPKKEPEWCRHIFWNDKCKDDHWWYLKFQCPVISEAKFCEICGARRPE